MYESLPGVAAGRLQAAVGGTWQVAAVLTSTGSTNDDVTRVPAGDAGEALGRVVVADHQSTGRGRLGRVWSAPPRASVAVSVLQTPGVPPAAWGWLPLLAGQAVRDTVAGLMASAPGNGVSRRVGDGVGAALSELAEVRVKWPNDVVIRGAGGADGKIAGLLTEVRGADVVIGAGINTNLTTAERPVDTATSVRIVTGAIADPTDLVAAYLSRLASWCRVWTRADGDATQCGLLAAHRRFSDTIGRSVVVRLPGGEVVTGEALTVAVDGRLIVAAGGAPVALGAGDVVHVR